MIHYGFKLWSSNTNLIKMASELIEEKIVDYIELMPIPKSSKDPFMSYKIPYIIHVTSERFDFNIADPNLKEYNSDILNENLEWADDLSADYLIIHPGSGTIEVSLEFLSKFKDNRILIENMPKMGLDDDILVGYNIEQLKLIMEDTYGFCLDFGHAIKAATSMKINYKNYIQDLVKLKPIVTHIIDGNISNEYDEHLSIGKGNYDFNFIMDTLKAIGSKRDVYATLETPRIDFNSFSEEIKNLNRLKSY